MPHNYAEGIKFYYHPKEMFDKLLDQVKEISLEEYNDEAKDGFRGVYDFWNHKSVREFNQKFESNKARIKYKR